MIHYIYRYTNNPKKEDRNLQFDISIPWSIKNKYLRSKVDLFTYVNPIWKKLSQSRKKTDIFFISLSIILLTERKLVIHIFTRIIVIYDKILISIHFPFIILNTYTELAIDVFISQTMKIFAADITQKDIRTDGHA